MHDLMRRSAGTPRRRSADGSVTAEAAVVLPIVSAFALAVVWVVSVGVAQIQVVDAARDAARSLARGDEQAVAIAAARRAAPSDAQIVVSSGADTVRVSVSSEQKGPGWLLVPLPALTVRAESTVAVEDDGSDLR